MKSYFKYLIVLLSAILLASPCLGTKTYYGGYDVNGEYGAAIANGGAYSDISLSSTDYSAEYGIDASVQTLGAGTAGSYTKHSETNGPTTVSVGGNNYDVTAAYGGSVQANAEQLTADGTSDAYAQIASKVTVHDDGSVPIDLLTNIYGQALIYASDDISGATATTSAIASGVAGYNVQSDDNNQEIWGSVVGTVKSNSLTSGKGDSGYASDGTALWAQSQTTNDNGLVPEIVDYAYSSIYAVGDIGVDAVGTHTLGQASATGSASSGVWDVSTPSSLTKKQASNEDVYAIVKGTTTTTNEGFLADDSGSSSANLGAQTGSTYIKATGERNLYSETPILGTAANANRASMPASSDRVTSTGYITDASYDAVARQSAITTETSGNAVNVASGAHALNPGSWYSNAYATDNYAEYSNGYLESWAYFNNNQEGPQFINSGTNQDDSGSYIRFGNVDDKVSAGSSEIYGVNIDNIDFMTWIEGSSLVNNMYPVKPTWTTTYTSPAGAYTYDGYANYFDNSNPSYRDSRADISADTYSV
jgi:hypothetical protein